MELKRTDSIATPIKDTLYFTTEIEENYRTLANYIIAGFIVTIISFFFIVSEPSTCDWYILPAIFCGVLLGSDVVSWSRGQVDPFDPKGLIGLVGFYGLFLVPILHVFWNKYTPGLRFHDDPRQWLLVATAINAVGLPLYKGAQRWAYNHTGPVRKAWRVVPQRIIGILACVVPVALGSWLYLERFKWQSGLMGDFVEIHMMAQGMGWLFIFGGQFLAVLLAMGLISKTMAPRKDRSWWACAAIFFIGAVGQLFLNAFSGRRGLILEGIFWIAGLIHYYWRRLSISYLLIGLICFLPFMYYYSFYKVLMKPGMLTSLQVVKDSKDLETETGRNMYDVLLGDLARADVQARIANEIVEPDHNYKLRYGRTYLFALAKLIPATIRQYLFKDPSLMSWSKGKAFIELNEGEASFDAQSNWGTRAFGLGGEAMLNFGLLGVPVAWLFFGLILGIFRRKRDTLAIQDSRWALVPFVSYWLAITPLWDLDVLVFRTVTGGFMAMVCIFLWSQRIANKEI